MKISCHNSYIDIFQSMGHKVDDRFTLQQKENTHIVCINIYMSKSHHIDYSEMVFPWFALSGDLQVILF